MKCDVVGVERKSGTFADQNGKDVLFDFFKVYVTYTSLEHETLKGLVADYIKIPAETASKVCQLLGIKDMGAIVGQHIDASWSNFHKIQSIELA